MGSFGLMGAEEIVLAGDSNAEEYDGYGEEWDGRQCNGAKPSYLRYIVSLLNVIRFRTFGVPSGAGSVHGALLRALSAATASARCPACFCLLRPFHSSSLVRAIREKTGLHLLTAPCARRAHYNNGALQMHDTGIACNSRSSLRPASLRGAAPKRYSGLVPTSLQSGLPRLASCTQRWFGNISTA